MRIQATYYLDITSSWCFWAEPAWAELKKRYTDRVEFQWKIALLDKTGLPVSRPQEQWFYRRSGTLMRSPFMLSTDWYDEPVRPEYLAPNCVAVAARELGFTDDRVRLALSYAALREGKRVGEWEIAAALAAPAAGLDVKELLNRARSPEIEQRVRAETAEFHAMQVTQRPTFVFDTQIGDRAVFSGFAKLAPLTASLDAMLDDAEAYISYAAHFGEPPKS
ncbi:MAG TPA: DsbA family protein [Chthoniobacterales bacterium]|jgi:predicted DsbA family dithiol-disulfide isomerase|nr:DsbA family protein [Chthoniobacterales bacterium]